jgi:pimeloyl-ACP methyl ester carboxylesterase
MRRFAASDGLSLALHEWGDEKDGAPVILQHGFSSNSPMNWDAPGVVKALRAKGRRVLALDARGHGQSAGPHQSAHYSRTRMAKDIMEVADLVGAARYDLAGYSMGGMIGVIVAAEDARVNRLAVCGCSQQILLDRRSDGSFSNVPAALRAPDKASVTDPWARTFRAVAERMGGDLQALAACFEGIEADPESSRAALARIAQPALILGGRSDPLMAGAQELSQKIARSRLEWVEGDHLSAVVDPRFAGELAAFLA